MTEATLQSCMTANLGDLRSTVLVAWPSDRVAVKITGAQLVATIDDLWYPGMDDLVVVCPAGNPTKVVVLDHEEQLSVIRLPG
ncbi:MULTISPECIES: hypothetical protein [unclassified Streptomyces]|uniref:hypothetical protein n=1 Tax=unclassified Streptomyces TaxID=2593676 RepID=UPI0035DFDB4D